MRSARRSRVNSREEKTIGTLGNVNVMRVLAFSTTARDLFNVLSLSVPITDRKDSLPPSFPPSLPLSLCISLSLRCKWPLRHAPSQIGR